MTNPTAQPIVYPKVFYIENPRDFIMGPLFYDYVPLTGLERTLAYLPTISTSFSATVPRATAVKTSRQNHTYNISNICHILRGSPLSSAAVEINLCGI